MQRTTTRLTSLPRTLTTARLLSTTPRFHVANTTSPTSPNAPNKAASETTGTNGALDKKKGSSSTNDIGDNPEGGVQSKPTRSTGIGNKGQPNAAEEKKKGN